MNGTSITRLAARGGIVGLIVPLVAIALIFALDKSHVRLPDNQLPVLFFLGLATLEVPGVAIGRALDWPIETGDIAFLLFALNAFGYALVVATWGVLGALVGVAIGLARSNSSLETKDR